MDNAAAVIRDARREDLPRIIELLAADQLGRQREVVSDPPLPEYVAAFDAIVSDSKARLLVLELEGQVVGTLQMNFLPGLSRRGAERAQLEAVRVAEGYRGRGLGRRMVEEAIAMARARGCRLVQLTSDLRREDAQRFYRSLGFVHSHAGMKLSLDADS
jgi:ribosomal protein S18 acetylase RimI-like enzyme